MASGRYTPNLGNNSSYSNGKMSQELDKIKVALDNTLSRYADQPNQMESDLDMNSNQILNLQEATQPTSPVTLEQMETFANILSGGVAPVESIATVTDGGSAYPMPAGEDVDIASLFVFVGGVFQSPKTDYNVINDEVVFLDPPAAGQSLYIRAFIPKLTVLGGEIHSTSDVETKVLAAGQVIVDFQRDVASSEFYVSGTTTDNTRLFAGEDYLVTGEKQITLLSSYPAGTKIHATTSDFNRYVTKTYSDQAPATIVVPIDLEGELVQKTALTVSSQGITNTYELTFSNNGSQESLDVVEELGEHLDNGVDYTKFSVSGSGDTFKLNIATTGNGTVTVTVRVRG